MSSKSKWNFVEKSVKSAIHLRKLPLTAGVAQRLLTEQLTAYWLIVSKLIGVELWRKQPVGTAGGNGRFSSSPRKWKFCYEKNGKIVFAYTSEHYTSLRTKYPIWPLLRGREVEWVVGHNVDKKAKKKLNFEKKYPSLGLVPAIFSPAGPLIGAGP